MLTLVKYAISVFVWAAIASFFVLTGNIVYLVFWSILGLALIIVWIGHMTYHVMCWFNPLFKPIKLIVFFIFLVVGGLIVFKVFITPKWNTYGSTKEEIEREYKVDDYCKESDIRIVRTVEINAPPDYIFRWVRQMPEVGTYTWSVPGLFKLKSVERLVENLPDLREGDDFLIGKVVEVDKGKSLTLNLGEDPRMPKLGIKCLYSGYYFKKADGGKTRVSMVVRAEYDGVMGWFYSQMIIEIGDFFFASKQLSKLKELSEKHFGEKP